MKLDVTQRLTRENISELVQHFHEIIDANYTGIEKRKYPRRRATGVIEFWPADGDWQEPYVGECCGISEGGIGMRSDEYLEPYVVIGFVVHLEMASFHGLGTVRYCQEVRDRYMSGIEFILHA